MQICHEIFVHNTLVTLSYRLKTHKQFAGIVTVKSPTLTQTAVLLKTQPTLWISGKGKLPCAGYLVYAAHKDTLISRFGLK